MDVWLPVPPGLEPEQGAEFETTCTWFALIAPGFRSKKFRPKLSH
jgi:hypothetical protein